MKKETTKTTKQANMNDYEFYHCHDKRTTFCILYNTKKDKANIGVSFCHEQDKFNRKEGNRVALERAINNPNAIIDIKTFQELITEYFQNKIYIEERNSEAYEFLEKICYNKVLKTFECVPAIFISMATIRYFYDNQVHKPYRVII